MKPGVIGLLLSGRSTAFGVLTRRESETASRGEDRLAIVRVPNKHVDRLNWIDDILGDIESSKVIINKIYP